MIRENSTELDESQPFRDIGGGDGFIILQQPISTSSSSESESETASTSSEVWNKSADPQEPNKTRAPKRKRNESKEINNIKGFVSFLDRVVEAETLAQGSRSQDESSVLTDPPLATLLNLVPLLVNMFIDKEKVHED